MVAMVPRSLRPDGQTASARLNRECFCITLDRLALSEAMSREAGDADFGRSLLETRPTLFSNAPVFLSEGDIARMLRIVRAVEAATALPGYREAVLSWAQEIARRDFGPRGVFMGYDFHLAADGPKLIEVNTNAGGAFLNAMLAKAQRACCAEIVPAIEKLGEDDFDQSILTMFKDEWRHQRRTGTLRRIAVVDEDPESQYLYPEFLLARRFFLRHGIEAIVVDPGRLHYEDGRLSVDGDAIDLVYNRLVDFSFARLEYAALRAAYLDDAVVVTPNPRVHALFADKRNMTLLSDQAALRSWGLSPDMLADLAGVPRSLLVTPANAPRLWAERKRYFFKPACGHGSKAVYRGDKLTKGVWAEIVRGDYVAQEFCAPGERMIRIDGSPETLKLDVRLYVYDGRILHTAARLYQGQTTNFRTPGGGFAPVFAV
jgi:hypothetical protein